MDCMKRLEKDAAARLRGEKIVRWRKVFVAGKECEESEVSV